MVFSNEAIQRIASFSRLLVRTTVRTKAAFGSL